MTAPLCLACGYLHDPRMRCEVAKRIVSGHETNENTGVVAINNVECEPAKVAEEVPKPKTANRRDRESYNAYMRDYMKKRREKAKERTE